MIRNSNLQNYYFLKGGTSIPAGADLKSTAYLVPGNYYCSSNALISGLKNCPVNKAFVLKVDYSTGTANYIRQKFIEYDTEHTISRVYDSSASGWLQDVESVTKSDLPKIEFGIYEAAVNANSIHTSNDIPLHLGSYAPFVVAVPVIYVNPGDFEVQILNITSQRFLIRVKNNSSSTFTVPVWWMAIKKD